MRRGKTVKRIAHLLLGNARQVQARDPLTVGLRDVIGELGQGLQEELLRFLEHEKSKKNQSNNEKRVD